MSDMCIRMDGGCFIRKRMDNTILLDIRSLSDSHGTDVTSEHSARADITPSFNYHVSNKHSQWVNKRLRVKPGYFPLKFIQWHAYLNVCGPPEKL